MFPPGFPRNKSNRWFLTGSVAKNGKVLEHSDIDLICVTKYAGYIYAESCIVDGWTYQIVVMPLYKLPDILALDSLDLDKIYITMLENAIPIFQSSRSWLLNIRKYIAKLKNTMRVSGDEYISYVINHITELCSEMMDERNDKLVVASDLLAVTLRFVLQCPKASSKCLGRKLLNSDRAMNLRQMYVQAIISKDFTQFVQNIKDFIQPLAEAPNNRTTGISLNVPNKNAIILYIPQCNIQDSEYGKIRNMLISTCRKYPHYFFYISSNQTLKCGTYLYVVTKNFESDKVIAALMRCHERSMPICINQDVKIIFPFDTAFDTGYLFGGKLIFDMLVNHFCALSNCFHDDFDHSSDILSYGINLCLQFAQNIPNSIQLLNKYMDSIALDAVDPNGIYNIRQSKYAGTALRKHYECMNVDFVITEQSSTKRLRKIVNGIFSTILSIQNEEILFPDKTFMGSKRNYLFKNVLDHMLSICCYSQQEKYAILYATLKLNQ